jgi:hypothetical protein
VPLLSHRSGDDTTERDCADGTNTKHDPDGFNTENFGNFCDKNSDAGQLFDQKLLDF